MEPPFDLTFGLLAYVIPARGQNGQVDFLSTDQLTSIAVKANGQVVDNFDVDTGSGAIYTATGVSIVPLPAALPLMLTGLIGLGSVSLRDTRG